MLAAIKTHLVPLLVGLAVLMAVGAVSGWVRASHFEGVAETHEARADSESERADSIQAVRLRERRADSIRTAALRDSSEARVRRAEEARRREAEERERRERARQRAIQSAADLRETLTPAQVPLFDAYEADRDMEVAALESELESASTRAEQAESEAASLWVAMDAKDALYGIAVGELVVSRAETASVRAALEAMRQANRSGGIFPSFGDFTAPVYALVGAGVGFLGGRASR